MHLNKKLKIKDKELTRSKITLKSYKTETSRFGETVLVTTALRNSLLKFCRIYGERVTPRSNIIIKIAEVCIGR